MYILYIQVKNYYTPAFAAFSPGLSTSCSTSGGLCQKQKEQTRLHVTKTNFNTVDTAQPNWPRQRTENLVFGYI